MCFSQSEKYIQDIFNPKQKIQLYKFAILIWNKMHFIELNLTCFYMIFKAFLKNKDSISKQILKEKINSNEELGCL